MMAFWEFFGVIGLAVTFFVACFVVLAVVSVHRDKTKLEREGRKLVRETQRALSEGEK